MKTIRLAKCLLTLRSKSCISRSPPEIICAATSTGCSPGQYQDISAQADCLLCPAGKYQDTQGQSDCKDCLDCETSLDGAKFCWTCTEGRYQDMPNQGTYSAPECKACPTGQFTKEPNLSVCTACPESHWAVDGSYQHICWHCDAGTYRVPAALSGSAPHDYECFGAWPTTTGAGRG